VAVAWATSAESFDPLRSRVTVPGTSFTVPVKVSTSWKLALPSAWMTKMPCSVEVPLKVPVAAGRADAIEGRRRSNDDPARRSRRRGGGTRCGGHREQDSEWDEQQTTQLRVAQADSSRLSHRLQFQSESAHPAIPTSWDFPLIAVSLMSWLASGSGLAAESDSSGSASQPSTASRSSAKRSPTFGA
jgi:hypothetical protein